MDTEKVAGIDATAASRDGLTAPARRGELIRYIDSHDMAKIEDLAGAFGVSSMTIHRDLEVLSREGLIERVRGGARTLPQAFSELDVHVRRRTKVAEKRALAREASVLIHDGDIVGFDDSTTVAAMFDQIDAHRPSAVITHSLGLMHSITRLHPEITLVGLGGQYYPETDSFLGGVVVEQTKRVSADVVFVSTTSLKNDALFHPDAEAALTKKAVIGMGDRKVLLMDSTKFEARGLYHVVDLSAFDDIFVESTLSAEHRAELDKLSVNVHYVETTKGDIRLDSGPATRL
ncbi:DeoR/GlpR family DNA-binding transcription regulator [Cryobacterium sp. GrIS_2_6]|uniref:DeoR/GlpR family DNA-binding transcription regulator n=1 Tax=Cryobacterium sp. GrIS_2_6 TaxID=3162785 RepID=UPI002DFC024C|nr:DeoR/GlpR family transcriptional regulator of sugar metabolism [Cryobacterium psychrotolerans]